MAALIFISASKSVEWALINSVWRAKSQDECQNLIAKAHGEGSSGACWAVFRDSFHYFAFGFYPPELYWRPVLAATFAALILTAMVFRRLVRQALLAAVLYPVIATWLIWGGFGLEPVSSSRISGFILLLVVLTYSGAVAIIVGFGLAACQKALILPARALAFAFVQFFGGIPPIVLIFAGSIFSAYTLPAGTYVDTLTLAACLIGLASAGPVAHVFSACSRQISKGQMDAARSLGFSARRGYWFVILPQVFANAGPQLMIILAKLGRDASLLIILSLLDPISLIATQRADSAWNGIMWELFLVVGGAYWIVSFGISTLGAHLERRLTRRAGMDKPSVLSAAGAPVGIS